MQAHEEPARFLGWVTRLVHEHRARLVRVARGEGHIRLKGDKCWTLLTAMSSLKGHEEKAGPTREKGVEHGFHPDHAAAARAARSRPSSNRSARTPPRKNPTRRKSAMGPKELLSVIEDYLDGARAALSEPFRGITAGGQAPRGLFPIEKTGVSTEPILLAAESLLASLTPGAESFAAGSGDEKPAR